MRSHWGMFSVIGFTFAVAVHAAPTADEYIKLLQDSVDTYGGTTEQAMKHVIDAVDKHDATSQFRLGSALMRVRHHFAAVEVLTRATELDPQNAAAFGFLGFSYYSLNDCDKALSALMKAVGLDSRASLYGAWNRDIGSCFIYKRDYAKAEMYCSKARDLLPTDPAPRLCLGQAQFLQSNYAAALSSFVEADGMSSTRAYPPQKGAARSGVLASLAKLNRLTEAAMILQPDTGGLPYTQESIERSAAAAISTLQRSERSPW
jgi:tetratricopeptide (TPR) repeat protein